MKNKLGIILFSTLILSSCDINFNNTNTTTENFNPPSITTPLVTTATNGEEISVNNGKFSISPSRNINYDQINNIYYINDAGDYTLSGLLENGKVIVSAPNKKVNLFFNGVTMISSIGSLIYVDDADKVNIKINENTTNILNDNRPVKSSEVDDETDNAPIFTKSDTDLEGKGTLIVSSTYNHGIHTKKDLNIKNLTLKVTATNNAIKANDSLTIESGNLTLISKSGNGLKTSNSDISSKGNQRGDIAIQGGNINIYSALDAIDAANNVIIQDDKETLVNIFTDKYSSYTGDAVESSNTNLYLKIKRSSSQSNYRYAACFYNSKEDYVWKNATYNKQIQDGRSTYDVYKISIPEGYINIQFYKFNISDENNSFDNYLSCSEGGTINQNCDTYTISRDKNGVLSGSWSVYVENQSSQKSSYSAKGIKCNNEMLISGGTISIKANDDAIHSKGGEVLENGNTGAGNIIINGGTIHIISSDDAIHADNILKISGGQISITESYEGLEGNQINIKGGTIFINSSDDGINAIQGDLETMVKVEGGYVDVKVGTGDTDAIDSNGNIIQTGGIVIAKSGGQEGMASALDLDGSFTITGGTFIGAGSIASNPTSSSTANYVLFGSTSSQGGGPGGWRPAYNGVNFTEGNYTISNTSISFTLPTNYSNLIVCSEHLLLNNTYTISNGSTSYTWSQTSKAITYNN